MLLTFSIKIKFLNAVFIIFSHFLLYTSFLPWRITATLLTYCPGCLYSYCLFAWHTLPMPCPSHHLPTFSFVFVSPAYHTAWHIIGLQDCVEWIKACRHIKYYMLCYVWYYFILYNIHIYIYIMVHWDSLGFRTTRQETDLGLKTGKRFRGMWVGV